MKLKYSAGAINEYGGESIVHFVTTFDKISDKKMKELDEVSMGALTTLLESGEFTGKQGEIATLYRPGGYRSDRAILVGLGEKRKLCADSYRKAAGVVSRHKALTSSKKAAFYFGKIEKEEYFQAAIEGYLLGSYRLLDFKTGEDATSKNLLGEITFAIDNKRILKRRE